MKKTLILLALVVSSMTTFAQQFNQDASLNLYNAIANRWLDVSYEYYINDESSAGLTFVTRLADENKHEFNRTYSVTPYYRYFITDDSYNSGIFGEAFIKINGGEEKVNIKNVTQNRNDPVTPDQISEVTETYKKYSNMALGLAGGYKYRSDKGFVAQGYAGVGRNLLNADYGPNVVLRLGISIGYAF